MVKIQDVQETRIAVKMELVCAVQIRLAQIHQTLVLMENADADQPHHVPLDIIVQMEGAKTLAMVSCAPRTRIPALMEHVNAERLMPALSYRTRVWEASVNAVHHQLVTQQQVMETEFVCFLNVREQCSDRGLFHSGKCDCPSPKIA